MRARIQVQFFVLPVRARVGRSKLLQGAVQCHGDAARGVNGLHEALLPEAHVVVNLQPERFLQRVGKQGSAAARVVVLVTQVVHLVDSHLPHRWRPDPEIARNAQHADALVMGVHSHHQDGVG